jgi:hypothetical protein
MLNIDIRFMVAIIVTALTAGCITAPTVDLTKAPFKASTDISEAPTQATSDLTNGTSDAVTDLTEPTKNFTSSTTPGSWFNKDGTLKAEHKVLAFAVFNFENLRGDLAQGHGEYLASFATLLDVPVDAHPDFYEFAQGKYATVYAQSLRPAESLNQLIKELSASPLRRLPRSAS